MRIAVLMGGNSEERDVSLASGAQVARALREAGHEVVAVDTTRGVLETGDTTSLTREPRVAETDLVFVALHGGAGEDGTIQALLDLAGIPYAGSGRIGCTLAMDKDLSKRLFRDAGVPTPDWLVGEHDPDEVVERLGLPLIVKPAGGGSTLGLTLVRKRGEIELAVAEARRYEGPVMYERYVEGRELTVAVVGEDPLPVGEIVPAHEIFDYECKYQPGMAEEIFPAGISDELAGSVQRLAVRAHRALRLRDFSRVDFIADADGRAWCLEANALPGMSSASLVPKAGGAAGLSFPDLCDRIVEIALARLEGA